MDYKTKRLEEFDKDFDHWILEYLMADDAFDMDLRESVARTELKEALSKTIEQTKEEESKIMADTILVSKQGWVEGARKEEKQRIASEISHILTFEHNCFKDTACEVADKIYTFFNKQKKCNQDK